MVCPRFCHQDKEDENTDRGNWTGKWDYLLSLAGYAIGLGNVWRFPYLCYRNGGGAFLIPYFTMLFFCGIPLFLLETSIGQFSSSGCLTVFRVCRFFKGAGYASCLVTSITSSYYIVIISYPVYYMYLSLTATLPWTSCDNHWNTPHCKSLMDNTSVVNKSVDDRSTAVLGTTPTDEFFHRYMLRISDSIEQPGEVVWPLAVCLMLSWVVVYFCIFKGVKLVGKVVYFTATFPFVMLFILFVRGITLPGAIDGVLFYLTPDFSRLTEFKVWADAAVQIFYSLGPGWGGLIMMSSFNRFNNNVQRDAIMVPVLNCFTSFFAGLVVFSVLGFMSHQTGVPIDRVASGGPSLAFITYPEALALLPAAPFWSCLFFFMLFLLGIDSEFVQIETVVASLLDELPQLRKRRSLVTLVLCAIMALLSLTCVTQGGMYVLQLLDWYCASISVICVCICEVIAFIWVYGIGRISDDFEFMMAKRLSLWWKICWTIVTPAILMVIFFTTIIYNTPVSYRGQVFPEWAQTVGWSTAASSMICIPLYACYWTLQQNGSSCWLRVQAALRPSADWGPVLTEHRQCWLEYCSHKQTASHLPPLLSSWLSRARGGRGEEENSRYELAATSNKQPPADTAI